MSESPIDKNNIVFIIFLIHGIGTLLPWNFVITANKYFEGRLKNDTRTEDYATNFLPYIGIASKLPNIGAQLLNFFILGSVGSLAFRILGSILIQIFMFILLILLVLINFDALTFYWLVISVVVGINIGNGVYQNCLYGAAALLPSKFTNSVVTGNNISGIFSALLMILTIAVAPDATKSAFYYFSSAVIYLIVCFISFIIVKNNKFYIFYKKQQFTDDDTVLTQDNEKDIGEPEPITTKKIFECLREIWQQALNTFLVFFVSLACFPSILSGVKPTGNIIDKEYFSAVSCFLFFNLFAFVGNYLSEYLPKIPRKVLIIPILMRFAFIPLFLYCNYQPLTDNEVRKYNVFIENDLIFMILVILHGFTSGWLSSLSMMYAPTTVNSKYKSIAGMVSSFCLILGIMAGINSSIIFPWLMFKKI